MEPANKREEDTSAAEPLEVAVLLPAAGRGTRLGGKRKQFRTLGGKPLLVQTVSVFERHPAITHIIIAAPSDDVDAVSDRLRAEGMTKLSAVVSGGDARAASVRHALRAVPRSIDTVLVHDAVRPFLPPSALQDVVTAVHAHGAAALAIPVADTLRRGTPDGAFGETVPRDGLYRMQTPQGFRRTWLTDAHRAAARADAPPATDDVDLVQRIGHPVQIVEGTPRNFKITTPGDWTLAQQLWPDWAAEHLL